MTQQLDDDPWAWLYAQPDEDSLAWANVEVTAVIEPVPGGDVARCRAAVERGDLTPDHLVVADAGPDLEGEWLWLLPADCEPSPNALHNLLATLRKQPDLDVIGPLIVSARRRGPGTIISQFGQTLTGVGRLRGLVEPGELYQGQLETSDTLGVSHAGMLVRGAVWRVLQGFNSDLPARFRGVDFGWRATLAGHRVVVEPAAQVIDRSERPDPGDARAAGLAIVASHLPAGRRLLGRARLVLQGLLAALGYVLGKDPGRARAELVGLVRWASDARLRRSLRVAARTIPGTPETRARVKELRPRRFAGVRRLAEGVADRFSDWLGTFTSPSEAPSLDEMTGDDFASTGRSEPRLSPVVVGLLATVVLALVAGRQLYTGGSLKAAWLLPAPASWLDFVHGYVTAVPGSAGLSGPGWTGLAGLASFVTGGQPEWLVTLLLMGCVPLVWLAAFRFLRQLLGSATLAGIGAFAYASVPALIGALNVGAVGVVVWTVLLPVFAFSAREWLAEPTWRGAGALGLWALLATAVVPLAWLVVLGLGLAVALRARHWVTSGQVVIVLVAPLLLLLGPWRDTLLAYPGRLLTSIEPTLASTTEAAPWNVLLGRTAGTPTPWWVSLVVLGGLAVAAVSGVLRRPGAAAAALAGAGVAGVLAVGLTRLVVWVPPGEWARPAALEWVVAMAGGLVLAAAWGLDGLADELRGVNLGLRHLGTLLLTGLAAVVVVVGAGWWVWGGETGLTRGAVGAIPPFVKNAMTSPTPGRVLALQIGDTAVGWTLLQDDLPRLGQVERGLVFSGDADAAQLAASVAGRLIAGSADDDLVPDLVSLGVSHVWLSGGSSADQRAISNTPGLGVGSGDIESAVWPVPDSGRAISVAGETRTLTGNGQPVAAGTELRLAEPTDPRWRATVDGEELAPRALTGLGQGFDLTGHTGTLSIELGGQNHWWAWTQLAGLALLMLLAAPGLRRAGEPAAPRRVNEPAPPREEPTAPRRAAGGAQ